MDSQPKPQPTYVLGSAPDEFARLDRQAEMIGRATRLLLQAAGISSGMRVLDLGTGLGHVARIIGELVQPGGAVVGIDRSSEALAVARQRTQHAGAAHVSFAEADITRWHAPEPFDAIVERLVLFHIPDAAAVVRHHRRNLRADGLFVAIDFDIGACRTEPRVPFIDDVIRWVNDAFSAAGAAPRIGARLALIVEQAGLQNVTSIGVQSYVPPHSRAGANLLAGVVRSLSMAIIQHRIATADELDLPTLEDRIADELRRANAVMLPPTVVGAWGRSALTS
jgi:ubiquinone/menaquinone biosynthesis C-methylase UbiE